MSQGLTQRFAQLGKVVQVVNYQTGALATGTTILPLDNTIPQITEGDQYMSLVVTPKDPANILKIDVVFHGANSATTTITAALFQDAIANALAASPHAPPSAGWDVGISFTHWMIAGGVSAITFRVRAGGNSAGTTTFNGAAGAGQLGGVMASSITITEYSSQSLLGSICYGKVVQVVNYQTGAVATGATALPNDDTIPQITEGAEFLTCTITPRDVNNILFIQVIAVVATATNTFIGMALFQDATANALAGCQEVPGTAAWPFLLSLNHYMTAGTISPTTFSVRIGGPGGITITLNGQAGARIFGGVMSSSITITELAP